MIVLPLMEVINDYTERTDKFLKQCASEIYPVFEKMDFRWSNKFVYHDDIELRLSVLMRDTAQQVVATGERCIIDGGRLSVECVPLDNGEARFTVYLKYAVGLGMEY